MNAYLAYIQSAITVGCSIDYNPNVCGNQQLAWLIPGGGGDVGKAVGDVLNITAALCSGGVIAGGTAGAVACAIAGLYEIANEIYNFFFPRAVFHGSLQPRPHAPVQATLISTLGVPINGQNRERQTGNSSRTGVPSSAFVRMLAMQ